MAIPPRSIRAPRTPELETLAIGRTVIDRPLPYQDRASQLDAVNECRHGRLAGDRTPPCGCWPTEGALVIELREPAQLSLEIAA